MSWRDAPLASGWRAAPVASGAPAGGDLDPTADAATIERLRRTNPAMLAQLTDPANFDATAMARREAEGVGTGQAMRIGAGKSLADLATGIKQLAMGAAEAAGLAEAGGRDRYTRRVQSDLDAYQHLADASPIATGAGELIGDVAATAGVPLGAAGLTARGFASAAGVNAGLAGAEFVREGESRAGNAAMGGALGAAGHGLIGLAGKSINAIRGRMRSAREQAVLDEARASGVPLTAGDLTQNPRLQALDGLLERIAVVGTGGVRTKQAAKATAMVQKLRDDYLKYVGGDSADEIKDALFSRMTQAKGKAAQLYDEAQNLAGDTPVWTANLTNTARSILQREADNIPNPAMQSSGLRTLLEPYTTHTALTFEGARALRSRLKTDIRNAQKNAVIGSEDVAVANRLVTGLEQDIQAMAAKKGGPLASKLREADTFYRDQVVPFKDDLIARTMKDDDLDLHLESWLKNPTRMRKIYRTADENGRNALRLAMIDKAMNFARVGPEGMDYISPERFTQQIRNMQRSVGEVFQGESAKQLEGVTRLMQHLRGVDRSQRTEATGMGAMKNMMTLGSGAAAGAALTGAVSGPQAAAALGTLAALRLAFSTNSGARLISAAADMKDKRGLNEVWNSIRMLAERNASLLDGPGLEVDIYDGVPANGRDPLGGM